MPGLSSEKRRARNWAGAFSLPPAFAAVLDLLRCLIANQLVSKHPYLLGFLCHFAIPVFANYDKIDDDLKAELPLKRIWTVTSQEDE
jgi:hypothetical protein